MACPPSSLPIAQMRREIVDWVRSSRVCVVLGATGSGKTTQLPQYLIDDNDMLPAHGCVAVSQPRRMAAISVATRVANERQSPLGDEVGYAVRWNVECSSKTRIKYMTDGVLLREFMSDRNLSRYAAVILDEAHERSMQTDILFGLMRTYIAKHGEKAPRLIIMSATLNSAQVADFFQCPVFTIPGRTFPVTVTYHSLIDLSSQQDALSCNHVTHACNLALDLHTDRPPGDILIFLTGAGEIERACDLLFRRSEELDYRYDVRSSSVSGLMILPLYGAMSSDQQQRVFDPAPFLHSPSSSVRRVIVSTNIAATSVTVDGIVYVIDSGMVKLKVYNPKTGLEALQVDRVSQSEAEQRMGRAGRTRAGECHRLYAQEHFDRFPKDSVPEIMRTSLTSVVLTLKSARISNVLRFPYLSPPSPALLRDALRQLFLADALTRDGALTDLGNQMAHFPLEPAMSRSLLRACQLKCGPIAVKLASLLSVESIMVGGTERGRQERQSQSQSKDAPPQPKKAHLLDHCADDYAALLFAYANYCAIESVRDRKMFCRENGFHYRALSAAQSVERQLNELLGKLKVEMPLSKIYPDEMSTRRPLSEEQLNPLREAMCEGHFHLVARRSAGTRSFHTMDGHATVMHVHPGSQLSGKEDALHWVVFHEAVVTVRPLMRIVAPVQYAWVKDLLPRLHQVDMKRLTSGDDDDLFDAASTSPEPSASTSSSSALEAARLESVRALDKLQRVTDAAKVHRNDSTDISEAKQRFLKRKAEAAAARGQQKRTKK